VGWSRDTIVGVWVGNNNNDKMRNVASGVSGAAPIWRRQMLDALSKRPDKPFTVPDGVSQIEVDRISGYPAHDGFASYKEWFINGSVPSGPDTIHTKVKVCKSDSSRLADPISISQGNYDEKEYVVIKEKDPLTAKDLWQKAVNQWIVKQPDQLYKPPTEVCGATSSMDIQIVSPNDHARVGDSVIFRFTIVSLKPIVEARLFLDDNLEQTFTEGPYISREIRFPSGQAGNPGQHTVRVTARDNEGKEESRTHNFAVNMDWVEPTTTPTTTPAP